jgi:hypothetical protein
MTLAGCLLASLAAWSSPWNPAAEPGPPLNSHLWIINELYSNADGTVQFVELWECCGSSIETWMAGKDVFSNTKTFVFPSNLVGDTAYRYLLLGTTTYAAMSGATPPDYIIPNNFFSTTSDSVRWHVYPAATLSFTAGQLPLDGVHSLNYDGTTGVNSPTNWAGITGTVSLVSVPALSVGWLVTLVAGALLGGWIVLRCRSAGNAGV